MMDSKEARMRETWVRSFSEQIAQSAYNTAAVEALARNTAYYLRMHVPKESWGSLHFLEMGCGAGANLVWLAEKGIKVSGVDIAPSALDLARHNLEGHGLGHRVGQLVEGNVTRTSFPDGSFDGILEACVFQHLDKTDRSAAFAEVRRLLKPGGLFAGYLLDQGCTVFRQHLHEQLPDDPGTVVLHDGKSSMYLTDIGLAHFFSAAELAALLQGFTIMDPCLSSYYLPRQEAERRGYQTYLQSMWAVYAVK